MLSISLDDLINKKGYVCIDYFSFKDCTENNKGIEL